MRLARYRARTAAGLGFLLAAVAVAPSLAAEAPLVAVDVGHSLARPGATSARGRPEFEFNRGLAVVVEQTLRERGFGTRLIGEQGDMANLADRPAAAAAAGADFFLSVHHDSAQPQYLESWTVDGREQRRTDRFSGYSLFVSRKNPFAEASLVCAQAIGKELRADGFTPSLHHAEPIRGENRPLADAVNGVYWFDDLIVLKTARTPAVLVEGGIILNPDDELLLREPATRRRIASAIAGGLQHCLGSPPQAAGRRR